MKYIMDCELKGKTLLRGTAAVERRKKKKKPTYFNQVQLFESEETQK